MNLNKHFHQIKNGGLHVLLKKIKTQIFIILKAPLFLILIPLVIIIRLISPWFLIRWGEIQSSRIGHFTKNTEIYLNEIDAKINIPKNNFIDFLYLKNKNVANHQLEVMWRRRLKLWPKIIFNPIKIINVSMDNFFPTQKKHEINFTLRDKNNFLEKGRPHINFNQEEEARGQKILKEFGVENNEKFICLLVRDSGYLKRHNDFLDKNYSRWSYHDYRNGNIDNYILACEELAKRGYYIFRMGINVLKPLKSNNPKIIDYANLNRSDFMDIYLGSKCTFCISTAAGFDEIPNIFRRPIAYVGYTPIALIETHHKDSLIITKKHINKQSKKILSLKEIFLSNVGIALTANEFEKNNIELEENKPEEIKDLVIEMDERLNNKWHENDEDLKLQKKTWSMFKTCVNDNKIMDPDYPTKKLLHGKINAKFGANFLRQNKSWVE